MLRNFTLRHGLKHDRSAWYAADVVVCGAV